MARARLRCLGKFNRIVNPGLHFLISFIERRAANINLRTQEARYSLNGKTKDNVAIGTAVSVQFHVDQMPAQSVEQSGVYRRLHPKQPHRSDGKLYRRCAALRDPRLHA